MNTQSGLWGPIIGGFIVLGVLSACAVGVGYDGPVGYDGGFYEPYGYDYGGWGGRYHVGPPRGGAHVDGARQGGGGRGAPSIPSGARGGGHGGGGHGH